MVRRIGKVLRFEAESTAMNVRDAALAFERTIQKVATVELDPGLRRVDAQHAAAGGLVDFSGFGDFARLRIEHPVMVVALAEPDLLVVSVDAVTDARGFLEIEWR